MKAIVQTPPLVEFTESFSFISLPPFWLRVMKVEPVRVGTRADRRLELRSRFADHLKIHHYLAGIAGIRRRQGGGKNRSDLNDYRVDS